MSATAWFGPPTAGQLPVDNPQDWLPDVSPAQLERLSAESAVALSDPLLAVIARRLGRIQASTLAASEPRSFPWHDPAAAIPYQIYTVQGTLVTAESFELSADPTNEGSQIFWLAQLQGAEGSCQLLGLEGFADVAAASPENRQASARAIYLALVSRGGERIPLLATRRLAWHPLRETAPGTGQVAAVTPSLAALGAAGVDVGLLLTAPARNGRNLDHDDSLTVLQLVATADQALQQIRPPLPSLDIVTLLREPRQHTGEAVAVYGTLDRVTTVDVRGNRLARLRGITQYYQLDLHVPLGDRLVNVQGGKTGQRLTFEDVYPVTVLTCELPAEIRPGGRQHVLVEFPAFVYRMWSYASVKSQRIDPALRQVVPILIAGRLQVLVPSSAAFSRMTAGLVVGGGIGLLCLGWWFARSGSPGRRRRHDLNRAAPPDFSQLAAVPRDAPPGEIHDET